uniref:GH18 domain-containing protein n=1 Tax=Ditylenchus dipsaci TaxID=166011 RepID=A0A915EP19_9BILA
MHEHMHAYIQPTKSRKSIETPLQYKHTKNKIRGCYVPAPLNERKMAEQFNLEDYIDDICTHMFIPVSAREEVNDEIRFQFEFYADLQGQKPVMDCENQGGHGCTVLQNLKILSPRLSTVLSLSLDEKLYTKILNEKVDKDNKPSKMDSLIDNLLKFAFERSFDGIEFSWTRADKHNDAFHIFARIPAYQTAEIEYVKDKDWMKNLAKDIDYLNLSTFLFQETPLEIMYGHEAIAATPKKKKIKPIRKLLYDDVLSDAVAAENENGIHMVEKWINAGMPRSKIVYGMPFNAYGISLLSAPQKKDNEKIEKFETKKT